MVSRCAWQAGGDGDDVLIGGAGGDTLDGGDGDDTVSYASAVAVAPYIVAADLPNGLAGEVTGVTGVYVNLNKVGTAQTLGNTDATDDTLSNIENLIGSAQADVLIGNAEVNRLDGGDGNDHLSGGAGADRLDGGDGTDTASYAAAVAVTRYTVAAYPAYGLATAVVGVTGVYVNLNEVGAQVGSEAAGDVLFNIENLIGSAHIDVLIGNNDGNRLDGGAGNDHLSGGAGDDTLSGGAGDDTLSGGAGDDTLTGGADDDTFVFAAGHSNDTITDFNTGNNKIDLSAIPGFANLIAVQGATLDDGNGNTVITTPTGTITLIGVVEAALTDDHFIYTIPPTLALKTAYSIVNDAALGAGVVLGAKATAGDEVALSAPVARGNIDDFDPNTKLDSPESITTVVIGGIPYALITSSEYNGVQILNISDPNNPSPTATITDGAIFTTLGDPYTITTVKIGVSTYALVAADNDDGVQIIELPLFPTISTITITATGLDAINERLVYGSNAMDADLALAIGGGDTSANNVAIAGITGIDIAWVDADDTITLTKNGGGEFTTIEVKAILAALRYRNTVGANNGVREFSIVLTDADGLDSTATVHSVNFNSDETIGDDTDETFQGAQITANTDLIDGKGGVDTVSYDQSSAGVTVNLADNTQNAGGWAAGDVLLNIENVIGTAHADTLTGDEYDNRLTGGAGNDHLSGGAGEDMFVLDTNALAADADYHYRL